MGQIATAPTALAVTHDINTMFTANAANTAQRIVNARNQINANFCKPSGNTANATPKVRTLRFVAAELTRQVNWNEDDPSRGDRRRFLKWLTWVEMDASRRAEAKKIMEAVDHFSGQAGAFQITWVWAEDVGATSTFTVNLSPQNYQAGSQVTITITSTDIFHTRLGGAPEDD